MAIFASTTTSGYSDPLKAMNIKALEQRLKDQQAQMAAQQPDAASMATIPGGIGHVLGVVGDRMAQGRNEQALAAQKDELAKLIAADPNGENPQTQARMAVIAPDMYKDIVQQIAERRRQQDLFAQQDKSQTALFGHQDAAAKEAARVAEISRGQEDTAIRARDAQKVLDAEVAAAAQENRVQSRPTDEPLVVLKRALERGEINQDEFAARMKQLTAPKINEQEYIVTRQKESADAQLALGSLDKALALIDHPDSIFAGKGAGGKTVAGEWLPDKLTGLNPKTQENTQQYNQIMGGQALTQLAQMKGASSDKDVALNLKIANDPNATPDNKRAAIQILKEKFAYYMKINNEALGTVGGAVPTPPKAGGATSTDPAVRAGADPARAAGTDPAATERIVEGITEAQAKQLPSGTRFRLIDGRTGRAK